jgi:metal-responsive CopG/Arc/MetJ family transcriptional regulator
MLIARRQTLVQLSDEMVELLDQRAAADGKSRSSLIRDAVEKYLQDEIEAEKVRQYVEAYRRMPQTEEEMAGADAAADEMMRYLEAEEGQDGW